MKKIYYDVVEKFIEDFEKRTKRNVILKKDVKTLFLTHGLNADAKSCLLPQGFNLFEIYFEEKDIGFRSFSVPYFVENQTVIQYDGNNNDLIKDIEKVCTAYTDREIDAIVEAMPILKHYSSERKENLKDIAIIWRDHFLEENVGLLTSFVRMGVKPEDILAIDKGDSTSHQKEITETFKKLGFQVDILDNTAVANDILIKDGEKLVKEFIEKRKDKKIVILDDGAIVSRILTLHSYDNVVAFVELTVTGFKSRRTIISCFKCCKIKIESVYYI